MHGWLRSWETMGGVEVWGGKFSKRNKQVQHCFFLDTRTRLLSLLNIVTTFRPSNLHPSLFIYNPHNAENRCRQIQAPFQPFVPSSSSSSQSQSPSLSCFFLSHFSLSVFPLSLLLFYSFFFHGFWFTFPRHCSKHQPKGLCCLHLSFRCHHACRFSLCHFWVC